MNVTAWDLWMVFFVGAFAGLLGCLVVWEWRVLSARRRADIDAAMLRHPAGKDLDR